MARPFQSRGSVTVPLLLSIAGNWSPETFIPLFVDTLRTRPRVTVSDTRAYDMCPRQPMQRTRERQMPAPGQARNARARGTARARAIAGNSFVTLGH
jgi:hypothetical protein